MPDHLTPEEFQQLSEPWDDKVKLLVKARMEGNFRREHLQQYTPDEAATMRAMLARLIPQEEGIDLVGFIDTVTGDPLGRGDKKPGLPEELEFFRLGLQGLNDEAQARHGQRFEVLTVEQQDEILRAVRGNAVLGGVWDKIPADKFFVKLYSKALHGYFAHPKAWMRIGFYGPSYPEGYAWLGAGEVRQRHERAAGWDRL